MDIKIKNCIFVFNTVITIMIMTPGELKHVKFYQKICRYSKNYISLLVCSNIYIYIYIYIYISIFFIVIVSECLPVVSVALFPCC